jgi:hypothetical protein
MRNLFNRLDPHRTAGAVLCAISGAAMILLIGWALGAGSAHCPTDLGAVPVTGLDGRTICVIRAQ